jgi:hypothetical protein
MGVIIASVSIWFHRLLKRPVEASMGYCAGVAKGSSVSEAIRAASA